MASLLGSLLRSLRVHYEADSFLGKLIKFFLDSFIYRRFAFTIFRLMAQKELKKPLNFIIETTNICNANCLMCPQGKMARKKGVMSDKVFEKALQDIESFPVNIVWLSGFGEPLVDKKLIERLLKLKNRKYKVKFSTNGSLLKRSLAKKLISSGLDELNISFNAVDKDGYEKIMKNLKFEETMKNVENLLRMKSEKDFKKPIIRISSVLVDTDSVKIKKHLRYWSSLVDSVNVAQAHSWGGELDAVGQKAKEKAKVWPCRSLWHTIYIAWNGDVYLCCIDYEGKVKLGNIMEDDLKKIWHGRLIGKIRSQHLLGDIGKLPLICRGCNSIQRHGLDWFLPKAIN